MKKVIRSIFSKIKPSVPFAALVTLGLFLALAPKDALLPMPDRPAQTTGLIIAPNVMIVMANGVSMQREMDDQTYPGISGDEIRNFVEDANLSNTLPQSVRTGSHAEQPTSKFFLAKRAITEIMNDDSLSLNVNAGFATWRTTFAQPFLVVGSPNQSAWVEPIPSDINARTALTTAQRFAYAADTTNFKAAYVEMFPSTANAACPSASNNANTNTRGAGQRAIIGKDLCDGGKNVVKEGVVDYMTANTGIGGLPRHIVPNHLGGYWDLWSNAKGVGVSQNDYPSPNNFQSNTVDFYLNSAKPPNTAHFCSLYYVSDYNYFGTWYLHDYPLNDVSYTDLWDFRSQAFDASGYIDWGTSNYSCSGASIPYPNFRKRISSKVKLTDGTLTEALGATIMGFYSDLGQINESASLGAFSGWSGENVLLNGGTGTESMSANFPSGPAATDNAAVVGRKLNAAGLVKKPVTHMGVFLDLPDPTLGYVDQRETVKGFMIAKQMDASGLEYNSVTQRIAPDAAAKSTKGIRASDSGQDGQSPVYDSLLGASAYYSAYKKADPNDSCRSNHVLLLYDGRENSRYYYDASAPGGIRWADPAEMSKKLLDDQGVFTHVIIISGVAGDITDANRIAQAGGTTNAYVIGDYIQLQAALRNVFLSLQSKVFTAPPAVPLIVRGGAYAYSPVSFTSPAYGTLEAHAITATGAIDPTPVWDVNTLMTTAQRTATLYTSPGGTLTNFMSVADSEFAIPATSPLTGAIIKGYTIDPNFSGGTYLAGRRADALLGRLSNAAPMSLGNIMSAELVVDPAYLTYANGLPVDSKITVFSSNDGFLYAVGQADGVQPGLIRWAWMPSEFLQRLKNFNTFQGSKTMDGDLRVADIKVGAGFKRVVLGVADGGSLHYALEVSAMGGLSRVLWSDFHPTAASDPKTAPQVWRKTGVSYAVYVTGTTLRIRNIDTGATTDRSLAGLSLSGSIRGLHIRGDSAFLGTAEGQIFESNLVTGAAPVAVGTMKSSGGGTVSEVGVLSITTAVIDGAVHLVAQSTLRMTVFSRTLGNTGAFTRLWSAFAGGSETSPSLAPVAGLPPSGRFSASPVIVEGVIFAPVTIDGTGIKTACVLGDAKLYFYNLGAGTFPAGLIYDRDLNVPVTGAISLGQGDALGVRLAQFPDGQFGAYGSAQAAGSGGSLSGVTALTVSTPSARVIWWKEVDRDQY